MRVCDIETNSGCCKSSVACTELVQGMYREECLDQRDPRRALSGRVQRAFSPFLKQKIFSCIH